MPAPAIVTIETAALGDRSYLVHDGTAAAVVDPQRDTDRIVELAASLGVEIVVVAETHLHNDYVSGGLILAEETGAAYLVAAGEPVEFERTPVHDGDRFAVGSIALHAVATPGHTPGHVAYVVEDADGTAHGLLSGGSMLYGSVGRTDLLTDQQTPALSKAQFRSVRRLAELLPDSAGVYPTHGFGSFCAASTTTATSSTVGEQRRVNPALIEDDEETFAKKLIAGFIDHPPYYVHMMPLNRRGAARPIYAPPEAVDVDELRRRLAEGGFVIDLRQRRAFAASHVRGMLSFELSNPLATYVGWTIPWDSPFTIVGATADDVVQARRHLSRIGIDERARGAIGSPEDWQEHERSSYPVASFADLAVALRSERTERPVVVDVRRAEEWAAGHIPGAQHVPLGELPARIGSLPAGHLWVHCAAGYRAAVGAAWAERAGRNVTLVDDDWAHAVQLGLTVG